MVRIHTKTLKHLSPISRRQLSVFILIFAAIGGIIIWKSFAAPNPSLPGDLNNDNTVNVTDMSILLSNYGTSNSTADINSDGTVNVLDLSILLSHYGQSISSFSTNLTANMTINTPFTWTFDPGVTTTAGYFYADGVQLTKVTSPGPYSFNLTTTTLTAGTHTLGGSWDLSDGTHVTFPQTYSVTINNGSTGGGGGGTTTYDTAISYSAPSNRPAYICTRTVNVTSQSQLQAALNNLQTGDCVINTQPGGFSVSGEFTITKSLAAPGAMFDFKIGTDAVRFIGDGNPNSTAGFPSVWITGASNLKFYGGNIANQGVYLYPSTNITWWNFYAHDTSGDGFDLIPPGGTLNGADIQGEVTNWGVTCLITDPHAEKCTGVHGMNITDSSGSVINSRVALYAHDGRSGAGIELGSPSTPTTNLTIYLKANNLTMVAQSQVAGNGIQIWGGGALSNIKIPYIEVSNAQGRAIDTNGIYTGNTFSGITVNYGRATNVLLNPLLSKVVWDTRGGIVYQDVAPLP